MNKKHVLIESFIVFILSICILICSFLTTFLISDKEAKDTLRTYGNNIALIYKSEDDNEVIESSFSNIIDIRITILSLEDGTPILDINPLDSVLSNEDRYHELESNINSFYQKKSLTTGYETLYFVTKNNSFFIRVGLPISKIREISINVLIYGTIIVIIISLIFSIVKYVIYKKDINSLKLAINNLESVVSIPSLKENDDGISIINDTILKIKNDFILKINELQRRKSQNDFILDSINEGFIVLDENKNIEIINKYALNILDLKKEEIIDKNYIYLTLGNSVNEILNNFDRDTYSFDVKINGKIYLFIVSRTKNAFFDNYDESHIVIVFLDVTTNRLNETMKKEFFQNASHELKTPLTTIIGYESLITNKLIDDKKELKNAHEVVLKEASRMKKVIDDMLLLSQLESEPLKDNYEEIEVSELIDYIIDSLIIHINEKNIKIYKKISICNLKINPMDFDCIVRNLLSNAIKYNKEKGKINIELNKDSLIIEDTGIGISKEDQTRIFERFYRVDKSRSRELGGTGLGLAIVKHLIIKYNYNIKIESKIGIGTKIIIEFN